jgi:hypothetical protein
MPSFATDSALDYRIKRGVIVDALKTLCLSMKRKQDYKKERIRRLNDRLMGKSSLAPISPPKKSKRNSNIRKFEIGRNDSTSDLDTNLQSKLEEEKKAKAQIKMEALMRREKEKMKKMINREKMEEA